MMMYLIVAIICILISALITRSFYKLTISSQRRKLEKLNSVYDETLKGLKKDSLTLGSLAFWIEKIEKEKDDIISSTLETKKHPARKAAEEVRVAKAEAREKAKEFRVIQNKLFAYEAFAPWISEIEEYTVAEFLDAMGQKEKEEKENFNQDPVRKYLDAVEWKKFSESKINQLSLDRYTDNTRRKNLWEIGIQYERYIGYIHEKKGFRVSYHGAIMGKSDLGIDLICENETEIKIIQCKRLSKIKKIPLRENVVAQVYGSAQFYKMGKNTKKKCIPAIYTSYKLSDEAKKFAKYLDVEYFEDEELTPYPLIKCNISAAGEKIYHLPMDQQYDRVVVGDRLGEKYVKTVRGAVNGGFRRAYRWSGS